MQWAFLCQGSFRASAEAPAVMHCYLFEASRTLAEVHVGMSQNSDDIAVTLRRQLDPTRPGLAYAWQLA